MKVLLISVSTEKVNMPTLPLGLACVAAATQKSGHDVAMADVKIEKDIQLLLREAIEGLHPEMIGISIRNIDDQNMGNRGCPKMFVNLAEPLRHPTMFSQKILFCNQQRS